MNSARFVEIYSTTIEIPFWAVALIGLVALAAFTFWWRRRGPDS